MKQKIERKRDNIKVFCAMDLGSDINDKNF